MALLDVRSLSLSVGSCLLLEGATARVCAGQRVALCGRNGSGKTTLLRAIAEGLGTGRCRGREAWGHVVVDHDDEHHGGHGDHTLGPGSSYFTLGAGSVGGEVKSALLVGQDAPRWEVLLGQETQLGEEELRELTIEEALDTAACYDELCGVEEAEAWRDLCSRADSALGWRVANYPSTPIGALSPGSAKRAYLALALLRPGVQLLLLDEPTNHLDLPSVLWLQHALVASGKTAIVISHDSDFLDAVADHVWEVDVLEKALVVSHAKSYSAFRLARQVARAQQQQAWEQQQERRKKVAAAAHALREASAKGSKFTGSDNDKLQRDFKRDRAGRSGRKAKAMESVLDEPLLERPKEHRAMHIALEPLGTGALADSSLMLREAQLGYHRRVLPYLSLPISLRIDFGERIALVGLNGVGKSTLLRTLTREMAPVEGEAWLGRELRPGNLTQEHETLPRDLTPRQHMMALLSLSVSVCEDKNDKNDKNKKVNVNAFDAAQELFRCGLTLRQVDCPIAQLNPGARARVLLASFAARQVNLLVLDEPSNHLDEEAVREVLGVLASYTGTVVCVSHDRGFLRGLQPHRTLALVMHLGLKEVDSVESYLGEMDEKARAVAETCFQTR